MRKKIVLILTILSTGYAAADDGGDSPITPHYAEAGLVGNGTSTTKATEITFGTYYVNESGQKNLVTDQAVKLKNVDKGTVSSTSTEAINGAQLFEALNGMSNGNNIEIYSRLDSLSKEMKSGLASAIAVNSLFQPYGIGKFNLTAGVGGYKDSSAIAIGSGYRFDENLAIKAAIANSFDSPSSFTYSTSFNLEW